MLRTLQRTSIHWLAKAACLQMALIGCASIPSQALPAPAKPMKQRLANAIQQSPQLKSAKVGVYVEVIKTGRIVFSDNGGEPMIPASNLKLVTTATAMDCLGPDFRFETELRGNAPDGQGVIDGNLYLRGSGDPTWCRPYNEPDAAIRFFAKQLRAMGAKQIKGDLVGDDSAFDREWIGRGWLERYLLDSYAAPVSALSMNNNVVELSVTSQGVTTIPSSCGFPMDNRLRGGGGSDVGLLRGPGEETTKIVGSIGSGAAVRRGITLANPPLFTIGAFYNGLKAAGIQVKGQVRLINGTGEPAKSRSTKVLARYRSPKLTEIVSQINRESDNVFAQHLFKGMAHQQLGYGTADKGLQCVQTFMQKSGLSSEGLMMVDGCGLSVLNRISPRLLVGVLAAMWRHPNGQAFINSLPTGGEGTLTSRLRGLRVRAKTGTLDGHSGLSGMVVTAHGQTLGFSVLVNDTPSTWAAIELEDRIVNILGSCNEEL